VKQYGLSENGRAASGSGSGVDAARDSEARERMKRVKRYLKGLDIVAGSLKDLPFAFRGEEREEKRSVDEGGVQVLNSFLAGCYFGMGSLRGHSGIKSSQSPNGWEVPQLS
jgi:hypothetical protein